MNILFLCREPPYPPYDGGRIRTFNFMRYLATKHTLSLVAFQPQGPVQDSWLALRELFAYVHLSPRPIVGRPSPSERFRMLRQRRPIALRLFHSPNLITFLRQLVAGRAYDLIHVDEPYMAPYVKEMVGSARIMDHMDVEVSKQRRQLIMDANRFRPYWWLRWIEHFQWRSYEISSLSSFDAHCAVSVEDASYFRKKSKGIPVFTIPNGVDVDYFRPRTDPLSEPTLVYVGRMDYLPNADAVLWFTTQVFPHIRQAIPEAQFFIVGRDPTPEVIALAAHPGVHVTGTVPDVRPYYERAHATVVPLRIAGGTRLKILEAMAVGVPVLSTSIGAEGLEVIPGMDILTADTAQTFAVEAIKLLHDKDLRVNLSVKARRTVEAAYTWSSIGEKLTRAYQGAIESHQASRADVI